LLHGVGAEGASLHFHLNVGHFTLHTLAYPGGAQVKRAFFLASNSTNVRVDILPRGRAINFERHLQGWDFEDLEEAFRRLNRSSSMQKSYVCRLQHLVAKIPTPVGLARGPIQKPHHLEFGENHLR
jgi:hypothetical protein